MSKGSRTGHLVGFCRNWETVDGKLAGEGILRLKQWAVRPAELRLGLPTILFVWDFAYRARSALVIGPLLDSVHYVIRNPQATVFFRLVSQTLVIAFK